MLRLADDWVWDFWLADDGESFHLFFLKAPRSLGDPNLRHWNVTIGHAVSADLTQWQVVEDALRPAAVPAWDDCSTWTGSVVRGDDGLWWMAYTGTSAAEDGLKQRIGIATSPDLYTWTRLGDDAVSTTDARWYEQLPVLEWHDEAWRDPWVIKDPGGEVWHMLITARAASGPGEDRGVIGHAVSADLVTWRVEEPLTAAGSGFGHLEVPQVETVDGRPLLLFSCLGTQLAAKTPGAGGIWAANGETLLGPFDIANARRLTDETLYSGRIVIDRAGRWVMLAFVNAAADGSFVGEITDPMPFDPDLGSPASAPAVHAPIVEEIA
jgi:beta-fructofuranosidase